MPEEAEKEKNDKEKKKDNFLMSAAMTLGAVLGVALSIALFIWLPAQTVRAYREGGSVA